MATGDPPYDLMLHPTTLNCGCYVGVWHGVTPPPICDFHAQLQNTKVGGGVVAPLGATGMTPGLVDALKGPWRDLVAASSPVGTDDWQLDHALTRVARGIGMEMGEAACDNDRAAEHDLWECAMQAVIAARTAIARARELRDAEKPKTTEPQP